MTVTSTTPFDTHASDAAGTADVEVQFGLAIGDLLAQSPRDSSPYVLRTAEFERQRCELPGQGVCLVDSYPSFEGAACAFIRLQAGEERQLAIHFNGAFDLRACPLGGWQLLARDSNAPSYWIPGRPVLRKLGELGHVLLEREPDLTGISISSDGWRVALHMPADWCMDWVIWRFEGESGVVASELQKPLNVERHPVFLWGSKVNCRLPGDLYRFLIHGAVYTDDFVWPRKWKFCAETDAHGIYTALDALESTTKKRLYALLKRQVLYSVMLRQAGDGGWYHGEWTTLMESHVRFHNAAMSVLEAGLDEYGDEALRDSLSKAAAFLATYTDRTDLGAWFLHDSLERSSDAMEEMRRQTNTPWIPSRVLGKSPTNKLILNSHVDALVILDRYSQLTGDTRHDALVQSGCDAATRLLALRPAETLYRWVYRAVNLTLLPKGAAAALPAPVRLIKRLTWMFLTPRLHRVKRIFPRLVMPGGLIERHIAPLHHDINYHPVNVMDLARLQRRFPALDLGAVIAEAVKAVAKSQLLAYWAEANNRRFAVVVWADALYHLCMLDPSPELRQNLACAMLQANDAGMGLPASLLGGDTEAVAREHRHPCPSPRDRRLIVANLCHGARVELLVVNPTKSELSLEWEANAPDSVSWADGAGRHVSDTPATPQVPARGWLIGLA